MDIVIAGAEMRAAASPIEDALYELSSICTRVVPVIAELGDTGAFSSQNLDDKCQSLLAGYLHQLASSVESLHGIRFKSACGPGWLRLPSLPRSSWAC